jgi:tRNA 2-thiouridine synthesizing protein B
LILHTVNKSPFEKGSLDTCLRLAKQGSTILLIEDAVYAAMKGTVIENTIVEAMKRYSIRALRPDLKARGLDEGRLLDGVRVVDYGGFVDLAAEHDAVQSWF